MIQNLTSVRRASSHSSTYFRFIKQCDIDISCKSVRTFVGFSSFEEPIFDEDTKSSHRVWRTGDTSIGPSTWTVPVHQKNDIDIKSLLEKLGKQESQGGRTRQRQLGVLRENPTEDMRLLTENYTVPSLATAVRDREETLQLCAQLAQDEQWEVLKSVLKPYRRDLILERRTGKKLNLAHGLSVPGLEMLRIALMRMPRRVVQAHSKRAGVVLALCNVNGLPSLMLEKRSPHLRAHPDEVCLPGGMVSSDEDTSIVTTCLREMEEEIEGLPQPASVLGVLRCNWGEVHHLVGVAVTPVVCFVGEIGHVDLKPNPDEVSEVFTIPLINFLRRSDWIHREGLAPIFVGGPHPIWGLTGYIIQRFVKDILLRYTIHSPRKLHSI